MISIRLIHPAWLLAFVQLSVTAQAAPPIDYDAWRLPSTGSFNGQCSATTTCPIGFTCGSAVTGDGFLQRQITNADGNLYFQTIIANEAKPDTPIDVQINGFSSSDPTVTTPPESPPVQGPYAYFVQRDSDTVISVNLSQAHDLTAPGVIPVGDQPNAVTISPNGAFVYVANEGDATITLIRAYDRQIVDTLAVPAAPTALAIDASGSRLYVSHKAGNFITVIDLKLRRVHTLINLADPIEGLLVHPDGQRLYGLNLARAEALAIDPLSGAILTRYPLGVSGASTGQMVVAPTRDEIYIALSRSGLTLVEALNLTTGEVRIAPQSFTGDVTQLFLGPSAERLLLSTELAATTCDTIKNSFHEVDTTSLLALLIRDLALGEEVIASDDTGVKLVFDSSTSVLYRLRMV